MDHENLSDKIINLLINLLIEGDKGEEINNIIE